MTVSGKTHVYFNGMLYQISSSGTASRQLLWPVLLRGPVTFKLNQFGSEFAKGPIPSDPFWYSICIFLNFLSEFLLEL
uniref:Uncharacterized protein n=1 Tax=Helianthus annuus TaxID=4232 RepID=A0A251TA10_HELAN